MVTFDLCPIECPIEDRFLRATLDNIQGSWPMNNLLVKEDLGRVDQNIKIN